MEPSTLAGGEAERNTGAGVPGVVAVPVASYEHALNTSIPLMTSGSTLADRTSDELDALPGPVQEVFEIASDSSSASDDRGNFSLCGIL